MPNSFHFPQITHLAGGVFEGVGGQCSARIKGVWVLAQRGCGTRARKRLRIYRSNRAQLRYTVKASKPLKTDHKYRKSTSI